jgi:dipeptidyl aminopeptidase/acylaminoacyl peptidase
MDQLVQGPVEMPYGTWPSPISARTLTEDAVRFGDTAIDQDHLYWLEQRPSEKGRGVVCRINPIGEVEVITPAGYSVNSRVHEYGGGAFAVADGLIYFVDAKSQDVFVQEGSGEPIRMTSTADRRHADLFVDRVHRRLLCVAEQHFADREAENSIIAIDLNAPYASLVLAAGQDFYSSPRVSNDGSLFTYCSWNHPDMPWESSQVLLATFESNGSLAPAAVIAGGPSESAIEPRFSPDGELWFISDRSGFWNLHRWHRGQVTPVLIEDAEYGRAPWNFGGGQYDVLETGQAVAVRDQEGVSSLVMIDAITGYKTTLPVPYSELSHLRVAGHTAAFIGASALDAPSLVRLDLMTGHLSVLHASHRLELDPDAVSTAEAITYPTTDGAVSHALYYAPINASCRGRAKELPPLLVMSHGGPTSTARPALNPVIQFWTSRGFAVVDVNYRGSTGYGRAYRQALNGVWGIADVDDCVAAAQFLAGQNKVDAARMAIRGGSAGGYTTLCALAFRDVFGAGASYFGVGDLKALARDTHKFESRYLERLIGASGSDALPIYAERSPLLNLEGFSSPLLLLQGLDDKVVPPGQSSAVFEALRARGVPVAYLAFEGEAHGFKRADTIERAILAELYFYGRVFGFLPADSIEPVAIENAGTLAGLGSDL